MPDDPRGVQGDGLKNIDRQLSDLFKNLNEKSRPVSESMTKLASVVGALDKRTTDLKKTDEKLLAVLSMADQRTTVYRKGIESAASLMAESSDIMVKSESDLYKSRIAVMRAQEEQLKRSGKGDVNTVALFTEKRKSMEREARESSLKSSIAVSKANNDVLGGMVANVKLKGSQVASMAGDFLGVAPEAMGAIAAAAGIAIFAVGALAGAVSRMAKTALDAAKSGYELDTSFGGAAATGGTLAMEIRKQTAFGTMMSEEKAYALLDQARKNYVFGLNEIGKQYSDVTKMSVESRNQTRMSTVGFVMDMAKLSAVFGISQEEAVSLGTKIGVMTKSGMASAERGFFMLGTEAMRLGIPMANLVDTMGQLALQSDYMGQSTERSISETLGFTEAIKQLGAESAMGFKRMDPEKLDRITKQMVNFVTSMSQTRVMGLNMKPGGSFEQAISSVEMGGLKVKTDALRNAMRLSGIGQNGNITSTQALQFGLTAGFKGDSGDVARQGRQLASIMRTGKLNPDQIQKRMTDSAAADIDARINSSKTVGQQLATGADPLQVIAGILTNILKVIVDFGANSMFAGKSPTAKELQRSMSGRPPIDYAASMQKNRSVRHAGIG